MCMCRDAELNCVRMYICLKPALMELDKGMSTNLYFAPKGTAGLERSLVRGYNRDPLPPPKTMVKTLLPAGFTISFPPSNFKSSFVRGQANDEEKY